jgi:alanine racemase
MVAMVKAFSYGSGFYEIASILQYHRVDYLAVAFADEGVELREAGITMPIIVLNAEPGSFDLMINYNLEPEIYSHTALRRFSESAIKAGVTDYPIHVKLDTGMHRLGFIEMDLPLLIAHLKSDERLKVSSIFSHLAASDELVHDDFTKGQIDLFARLSSRITDELGYAINRHILNSAGIERFPEAEFDMVRLGIGLYGISAVDTSKLEVVSTLRSTIVQIKDIPANESVGYGRKGWVNEPKRTATIPIGYADGLNRKLSNGVGKILVKGQLAPIIGNICMDTCMIDVTGIDVKEGDEVTIFGQNPTITDIASWIGTIPYEILTSISRRVKRIYIQE